MIPLAAAAAPALAQVGITLGTVSLKKIQTMLKAGQSVSSLADLSKPARVEPICMVDGSLNGQPYMPDVMRTALSIFTGYYLQGAAMLMNIGRVETLRVLDSLNPTRSGVSSDDIRNVVWGTEQYRDGLPALEHFDVPAERSNIVATLEAYGDDDDKSSGKSGTAKPGIDEHSIKRLYESENLAVGKLINVEFRDGDQSAKIPIMIRLVPATVPAKVLTHIFTGVVKNTGLKERWQLYRAGQLRFGRDLILNLDLIDEHRKVLANDTTNVYMTINDRRRNNAMKAMATGNLSLADASNIAVISSSTAKAIGDTLYGKLSDVNLRKKVFDATYLILLIVIDDKWKRVTIYHRGLDQATDLSLDDCKSSEKGKGPDIAQILAAYQIGQSPSI